MQDIINVLKNNWEIILSVILFITSFIVCLIKKKPIKVLTSIYDFLMAEVIEAVNNVEEVFSDFKSSDISDDAVVGKPKLSSAKLSSAVQLIESHFKEEYPELNFDEFRDITVQFIEAVLSTPQKHEK